MVLNTDFYMRDARKVAKDLLGRILVTEKDGILLKAMIVETEAYLGPEDRASHAWNNRKTKRTEAMFMEGGYTYVYLIYGMYFCFNVVCKEKEIPHAVLIRAVEPISGIEVMKNNRGVKNDRLLTNGPGKLSMAMGIDRGMDKIDLTKGKKIWIEGTDYHPVKIIRTKRVGIEYAGEYKEKRWRYYIDGNLWVSKLEKEIK